MASTLMALMLIADTMAGRRVEQKIDRQKVQFLADSALETLAILQVCPLLLRVFCAVEGHHKCAHLLHWVRT